MTSEQEAAIAAIEAQQPKKKSAAWMVGEQLKGMVRAEPGVAALLNADLAGKGMTLDDAEEKIAERAKQNKVGNCGVVTPAEAEEILRSFYGLPPKGAAAVDAVKKAATAQEALRAEKEAAERTAREAQETAKKAEEARDRAQRELALANPDAAVFAALYAAVQEQWNKLHGAWIKAANADANTGEKLRKAARALAEKWAKEEW